MKVLRDILGGWSSRKYGGETKTVEIGGRKYRVSPNLLDGSISAIVCQSFGAGPRNPESSDYNEILAQTAKNARDYFKGEPKVLAQAEIARHLDGKGLEDYISFGETYEEGEAHGLKSKIDSSTLMGEMKEWMKKYRENNERVAIVAHPGHAYRVYEIGRKLGWRGGVVIPEEADWPKDDIQPWVRSPLYWSFRERLVRAHHLIHNLVPREGLARLLNIPRRIWDWLSYRRKPSGYNPGRALNLLPST